MKNRNKFLSHSTKNYDYVMVSTVHIEWLLYPVVVWVVLRHILNTYISISSPDEEIYLLIHSLWLLKLHRSGQKKRDKLCISLNLINLHQLGRHSDDCIPLHTVMWIHRRLCVHKRPERETEKCEFSSASHLFSSNFFLLHPKKKRVDFNAL